MIEASISDLAGQCPVECNKKEGLLLSLIHIWRVIHLNPMKWTEGWPVIGEDKDGDGCGEPVRRYRKPTVGKTYPVETPAESDEFKMCIRDRDISVHIRKN